MTIDDYFENKTEAERAEYARIESIVMRVVPEAEKVIAYGMPTFKYNGRPLLHFGVFKDHLSLFPASGRIVTEMMGKSIEEFKTSKGTLQFTLDRVVPAELVEGMLLLRMEELSGEIK